MNHATRYEWTVYHGGRLLGLGRWASGRAATAAEARAMAEDAARECVQAYSGLLTIDVQHVPRARAAEVDRAAVAAHDMERIASGAE